MGEKRADLDAIVFDVGNVLIDYQPMKCLLAHYPQALAERIYQSSFGSNYWQDIDLGIETIDDLIAKMQADAPDVATYIPVAVNDLYPKLMAPLEQTVAYLPRLRKAGYRLYLLSNFHHQRFDRARKQFPFLDSFDGRVISGEEKIIKPDPRIYQVLFERYGLNPQRSLFIDDLAPNIEAAIGAGMQGMVFTHPTQLEALFA